jgi:hypothetical protein
MTRFGSIAALFATALGCALVVGTAAAQDSRDDRYFFLRDPFRPQRGLINTPRDPFAPRPLLVEPRIEAPLGTAYTSAADADRLRTEPAKEYVLVLGDSLADQLAQGLAEAFHTERPEVAIVKKTRDISGFVRTDVFDWPTLGSGFVAAEKATAVVVLLGMNDRQPIRDETGAHEPRSDRWREIYTKRIEDFLTKLKETKVAVFIVGLPSMRNPRLTADFPHINEIFRDRAQKVGVTYVDVWDGFVNERGDYVITGPALDGQMRRLRTSDGIHFTRAGMRKLAHFVERDLVRLFAARTSPTGPQDTTTPEPVPEVLRPIAGPVISLTTPVTQTGALAGSAPRTVPMDSVAIRTLVEGLPADPVPGRADDFRWPQPLTTQPQTTGQVTTEPAGVQR